MSSIALLSSAFFAPIQWYQKLNLYDDIRVEAFDNFMKQTYRNRCIIATANGVQILTVPVERGTGEYGYGNMQTKEKCLMKDIHISDHGNWRHIHWNALQSAYGESPFFEFYADDIRPFFERHWKFLFDFNMEICIKMCELIGINPEIRSTDRYIAANGSSLEGIDDYRDAIHPKHPLPDNKFSPVRYYQVYERRHGFIPNLSILDLLFNTGNESILYLQKRHQDSSFHTTQENA